MIGTGQIIFNDSKELKSSDLSGDDLLVNFPEEMGRKEAVKEETKQQEVQTQKFEETVHQGTHVLYKASAFFPFDLFPDEISVDVNQVNIVLKSFFWTERRHSILIKDVTDVLIDTIPFFASIQIIDMAFRENAVTINFLKRSDAVMLRRIIQGLMVAHKQGIDLSQIDTEVVAQKVEELGKETEIE